MQQKTYKSWTSSVDSDVQMGNSHHQSWQAMIDRIVERDISSANVLDFGCNQGEFLRYLYGQRSFAKGIGIDLAADTILQAKAALKGIEPINYKVSGNPAELQERFDIAFSHEVLYLLPDLDTHAQNMRESLKEGGVYYAALGAHTDNPMWPRWYKIIQDFSPVMPQNYSIEDIARAFSRNNFQVQAQKMPCDGFIGYSPDSTYYRSFYEKLSYYSEYFVLFRMVAKR